MRVDEVLQRLDQDDIDAILADTIPGVSSTSFDKQEALHLFESIPVLKYVMGKSLQAHKAGDFRTSKKYNIIINTLVMLYKTDKGSLIDKILNS